ncbi:hypothetical protein BCR34DRAFT_647924, partial [Clohesyomyces aquaticus]
RGNGVANTNLYPHTYGYTRPSENYQDNTRINPTVTGANPPQGMARSLPSPSFREVRNDPMSLETIAPGCTNGGMVCQERVQNLVSSPTVLSNPSKIPPGNGAAVLNRSSSRKNLTNSRRTPSGYGSIQNPNDRTQYTNEQPIAILYLHVMLELTWNQATAAYRARYRDNRTVQGLQAKVYRMMSEWGLVHARQSENTKARKASNKEAFRRRFRELNKENLLRVLEKIFGPPRES